MTQKCGKLLESRGYTVQIESIHDTLALQRGAALAIYAETNTGCIIGADRAGAVGRTSEDIGEHVARSLIEDLASGATVDRYLADQLVFYAALADGISEYRIPRLTDHVETNLWLVENMLRAKTEISDNVVRIHGISYYSRR